MGNIKRQKSQHPTQPKQIRKELVSYRLVKEFKRTPLNEGNQKNQIVFWVVQWSGQELQDGSFSQPPVVFEKRRIYIKADGTITTYGLCGLTAEDLKWIAENWQSICEAVQKG